MRQTISTLTIIALLLLGGCATQNTDVRSAAKPLVFGVVAPLTGTNAFYGTFTKAGAELAIEEINKAGGVDGRNVQVIFEDTASDKAKATSSAKKLVEVDGADALFAMLTPMAGAVAPVAEESGVPLIYWSPSTSFSVGKKYVFQDYFDAAGTCEMLMRQAVESGMVKVALFGVQAEVSQLCKQGAERVGVVSAYETYNTGDSDFKTQFTKIGQGKPEAIILSTFAPDCKNAFKQVRELGIDSTLLLPYADTACGTKENTEANLDLLKDAYGAGWDVDENSIDPAFLAFKEKINSRGGTTQMAGSVIIYDSIKTMAQAYSGCSDAKCATDNLRAMHGFPGITGPISYDGRQTVARGLMLTKLEDGKWKKVK